LSNFLKIFQQRSTHLTINHHLIHHLH